LKSVLPTGWAFPFDFGFIPQTRGEDGDPLDVLVLMDEPAFAGCLVPARLIGAICAKQTERNGDRQRNDRLIAVFAKSRNLRDVRKLSDLEESILEEVEHFFVSFNQVKGKKFKPSSRSGPRAAMELVRAGMLSHRRHSK
jgi:inorganic pyrophosphatase